MLKRDLRLRKEYLLKRENEEKERRKQEKRQKMKECLESGKRLPSELANDTEAVRDLFFNENIELESMFDSEYANAGLVPPKILITTSRGPSTNLQRFAKDLRLLFPNSQKTNRGNHVLHDIITTAKKGGFTDLITVHENNGMPSRLVVAHLPLGPTASFSISNIKLKDEITEGRKVSEAHPHLVFDGFSTRLGNRVVEILKHIFPVPKEDTRRIVSFQNKDDFVSLRNHVYKKNSAKEGHKNKIELQEEGPSFDMKLYSIILGTPDIDTNSTEWILHPFMNTADKRSYL
ncbi:MAG: U3 snoRNP-associated protein Imp4 [Amphiamblys sp. WSBS2006]|nr:MAG: U3 snoRNP-associated protein Imp4 [Amphiamblys sp. WSBS2006]